MYGCPFRHLQSKYGSPTPTRKIHLPTHLRMPIQAPVEDIGVHNRQQNKQRNIRTSKAQLTDAGWLPGLPPAPLGVQQWHAGSHGRCGTD